MTISRRRMMHLTGSAAAVGMLPACTTGVPERAAPLAGIVDVHCHVFNASDLPVRGFAERVIFSHYEEVVVFPSAGPVEAGGVLRELALLIVDIAQSAAPSADDEIRDIDARSGEMLERSAEDDGDSPAERQRDVERLRAVLDARYRSGPQPMERLESSPLLREMAREAGAGRPSLQPTESGMGLAEALYSAPGYVYRHLRWAFLLTRSRRQITNRYRRLYAKGGVGLITPALIDFSYWLDDQPASPLERQIEVFDRLHRMPAKTRMHSFMAFDPWRQVENEEHGQLPTAFDLARRAIGEKGFIGIKLYPPMGFRATLNTEVGGDGFPERAGSIPQFPAKLDSALRRLFAWCVEQQVPVMAHAAATNPAGNNFALRADPAWWDRLLSQPEYRNLRLNLAHFGGFEVGQQNGRLDVAKSWEWKVGAMIRDGAYPNLYADLSYMSELLGDNASAQRRRELAEALAQFVQAFDPEVTHLLYGSDWIMLGREPDHDEMPARMMQLVREIGFDAARQERFFRGNALRFLGLDGPSPTRDRLTAYYARHGMPYPFSAGVS